MVRHVLIRDPGGDERIVPETTLLAEMDLHDVLTSHPELLPADDLEMGQTIVVGRESSFESGYADLVLVDADGQICLVEVKKEGNPDTRRVIAQLLDYAAALWQMSVEDFERAVLHPYLRGTGQLDGAMPDIASYVAENLDGAGDEDDLSTFAGFAANLEQTLATGHFRLVVAAPSIPTGVEKVIEYLNAQGHLIYGLEVSFFSGATECFIPNLVVKPRVSETKRVASRKPAPLDEEDFLQGLPDPIREPATQFLRDCEAAGARIHWHSYGAGIRAPRNPERVLAFVEKGRVGIVMATPAGYPDAPFVEAREATEQLTVGKQSSGGWEYSLRYDELAEADLAAVFSIALGLVESLVPKIDFHPLQSPLTVDFDRNDNNIWARSAPALNPYVGRWLQGALSADGGPEASVRLQPIRGGGPGWQPRFDPPAIGKTIWPADPLTGKFQLVLTHAADTWEP